MNVNAIDELANYIEKRTDKKFDMARHQDCILGFAADLWVLHGVVADVGDKLGITRQQGQQLFFALDSRVVLNKLTREQAVSTLRNLAVIGNVEW